MQKARLSGLIAMVATAVMVDGQRTIIQPGQELPELPEHDEKELLDSGAALDPAAQAASDKARKQEEQFAQQGFQEARERAMAAQASITPPATEAATSKQAPEPDAATAAEAAHAAEVAEVTKKADAAAADLVAAAAVATKAAPKTAAKSGGK